MYTRIAYHSATDVYVCCQTATCVSAQHQYYTNMSMTEFKRHFYGTEKNAQWGYRHKTTGILFVGNEHGMSILYYALLFDAGFSEDGT